MSSLSELEACRSLAASAKSLIDANQEIVNENNKKSDENDARHKIWAAKKQAYLDKLHQWESKTGNFVNFQDLNFNETFFTDRCFPRSFGCTGEHIDKTIPKDAPDKQCMFTAKKKSFHLLTQIPHFFMLRMHIFILTKQEDVAHQMASWIGAWGLVIIIHLVLMLDVREILHT